MMNMIEMNCKEKTDGRSVPRYEMIREFAGRYFIVWMGSKKKDDHILVWRHEFLDPLALMVYSVRNSIIERCSSGGINCLVCQTPGHASSALGR